MGVSRARLRAMDNGLRKLSVAVGVLILAAAAHAHAATSRISFGRRPVTEDEKAVAQVLEAFANKAGWDGLGASELFTQDAVVHWVAGEYNERRVYEGRDEIAVLFTSAALESTEYRGVTIKIAGDRAEATGQSLLIFRTFRCKVIDVAADCRWLRRSRRVWKLRREPEGWLISSDETLDSELTLR